MQLDSKATEAADALRRNVIPLLESNPETARANLDNIDIENLIALFRATDGNVAAAVLNQPTSQPTEKP